MSAPSSIAHYRISAKLGQGGMGAVYRATDTKLNRDVAVKILPDTFGQDPDRLARFTREARVLASLNHPNIAAIYGVEERALVMELVEGPTLAERIARGPIPLENALLLVRQITSALAYAHDKGIIHRDLKPDNIKITPEGRVKLLDFGLAKALAKDVPPADSVASPTITAGATIDGTVLGTPAYMAPEQVHAGSVDKRADVWAFGVVLYEMLSGRQAFARTTIQQTLSAVLSVEPDLERIPVKARKLVACCLEKDPELRLRDAGDAWRLFEETQPRVTHAWPLWWLAGVLATIAAIASWMAWRVPAAAGSPMVRLALDLGADESVWNVGPSAILSPDGARVVFVSQGPEGKTHLSTRRLDESRVTELPGTSGAYNPFFSPDGQWVGFFAGAKLMKTRLAGGEPVFLCDAASGRGASWSEDGTIIATLSNRSGLSRIPGEGGTPTSLSGPEGGEQGYRWPQLLPGGKGVLCNINNAGANFGASPIVVVPLAGSQRKVLRQISGMYPRYVPSGHIVYVKQGTLFAVPFDLDHLEVRGPATQVFEQISADTAFGFAQFDLSRSGAMLYRTGTTEGVFTIQWLDGAGTTQTLLNEPGSYRSPRVSPDGGRVAVTLTDGITSAIWVYDWKRGSRIKLTAGSSVDSFPVWSPDGLYLVFRSSAGLSWVRADGAREPQLLVQGNTPLRPCSFTQDGKRLVYDELTPGGGTQIRVVSMGGDAGEPHAGSAEQFLQVKSDNPLPSFSGDGRWLAYADTDSGRHEVYVRAFPDKGSKWQVSNGSGIMPAWSPKSHQLFYRTLEDHRIMVADYSVGGDSFVAGKPRPWSPTQIGNTGQTPNFGIAPDGLRFAVLMPPQARTAPEDMKHVTLVLNFFDELRRRVPAAR